MGLDVMRLPEPRLRAFEEIEAERARQERKWGDRSMMYLAASNPLLAAAVLGEEVGEVNRALLGVIKGRPSNLREELVQVAAVAVAWLEAIQ